MNTLSLGIVGSRDFDDYALLCAKIREMYDINTIEKIVSGGANGADKLAERYAKDNNLEMLVHNADWNKYGKTAGYIRNKMIWEDSDVILAFWDGKSNGTRHTIDNVPDKTIIINYKKEKQMELRIGEVAITGRVSGLYDREESERQNKKVYTVKRATAANGKRYQVFEISVAKKEKDSDEWTNGKGLKVMLFGDVRVDNKQEIGIKGKLVPDNYTNKEGKEVRGNMLMAFADDLFTPAKWDAKPTEDKPKAKQEDDIPAW